MIKKIPYNADYLPSKVVQDCFELKKHNFVDKQVTGNGFTTGFLNIAPTKNKTNIIIVPNKGVVQSKQSSYNKNTDTNKLQIGFIYGDDSADRISFRNFDVLMFVVDSFLNNVDLIKENEHLIDKILIDEVHSISIQSSFRSALVGFTKMISSTFSDKSIVSVTATPMLFQKVDIKLVNPEKKQRDIFLSHNQENTLKRLNECLKNGENVIIALQDARILNKVLTSKLKPKKASKNADLEEALDVHFFNKENCKNHLTANLKVGKTLLTKIIENVNIKYDESSNLTIISSAGFEGFDVENGINNVFIFEDRAFDYQTFYAQNIVQIIGRSRQGTSRIEWCRIPNSTRTPLKSKEEMIKKSQSNGISFEKKMTDKNYTFIPKYFDVVMDGKFGLITNLTLNVDKYDLQNELNNADLIGLSIYDDFFKERAFSIINLDDGHKRLNLKTPTHKKAFENVKSNVSIINRFKPFEDLRMDLYPKDNIDAYIKSYEVYLRRKYWDASKLPFKMEVSEYIALSSSILNEMDCYLNLKNPNFIDNAVSRICKDAKKKKQSEISRKSKEYLDWMTDLEKNIKDRYIRLLVAFSQSNFKIPNKIRNSRNYNLFTEVSMLLIEEVASLYDIPINEVDITTCNPRIIYAFCGLSLPSGFYGENKENKKRINILLNKISKDLPTKQKLNIIKYKENILRDLRKYSFDEKVITFLINNFWDKPKDALFNFCAYHEKEIINKLTTKMINSTKDNPEKARFTRRHDSVIIVGNPTLLTKEINSFEYLGFNDWFIKYEEEIEIVDVVKVVDVADNDDDDDDDDDDLIPIFNKLIEDGNNDDSLIMQDILIKKNKTRIKQVKKVGINISSKLLL